MTEISCKRGRVHICPGIRSVLHNCLLPGKTDPLSQALYYKATGKLSGDMLVKVDRMSMFASLEVRSPLLDHELADVAATVPHEWKIRKGQKKHILIVLWGIACLRSY